MKCNELTSAVLLVQSDYQPGDPAPEGYLAWHEWAEVQHKSGLRQEQCGKCGLWRYPQEFSSQIIRWVAQSSNGPLKCGDAVCKKCST